MGHSIQAVLIGGDELDHVVSRGAVEHIVHNDLGGRRVEARSVGGESERLRDTRCAGAGDTIVVNGHRLGIGH